MKNLIVAVLVACGLIFAAGPACAKGKEAEGKALFDKHCASCHKDGGNIINPQKTLKKASLEKSGIKSKDDIVKKMRTGGGGMPKFDEKTLPHEDAEEVAEYIQETFK